MSKGTVQKAKLADAWHIAMNLRDEDLEEIKATSADTALRAITRSYFVSTHCWSVYVDGVPCAIFGVAPISILGGVGSPWMMATADILKVRRQFVRECRTHVKEMQKLYPRLVNFVDTRNNVSIRWLRWLGFDINDPVPYGVNGEMFHPFRKVA